MIRQLISQQCDIFLFHSREMLQKVTAKPGSPLPPASCYGQVTSSLQNNVDRSNIYHFWVRVLKKWVCLLYSHFYLQLAESSDPVDTKFPATLLGEEQLGKQKHTFGLDVNKKRTSILLVHYTCVCVCAHAHAGGGGQCYLLQLLT